MKKALISAAAVAATLAIASAAQAQEAPTTGAYVNFNAGVADSDPVTLWAVQGRLGYRFHQNFGVEGEIATGVKSDDITVAPGVSVDFKLKHQLAAYLVGFLPAGEKTDLIARVGYGTTKIKGNTPGFSASVSDESFNFGVGVQHHFDDLNGIRADFTRFEYQDDGSANVWSIGYSRKF